MCSGGDGELGFTVFLVYFVDSAVHNEHSHTHFFATLFAVKLFYHRVIEIDSSFACE